MWIVIVLDGGTFHMISPFIEKGVLQNFQAIANTGACRKLRSTMPPNTSPAFDSLLTDLSPVNLGIYGFLCRKQGSYEFVPHFIVKAPKSQNIWRILSRNGCKVGIANVPTSYN